MIQSVEQMGLRVERVTPEPHMINVDVNSDINIVFNSDLNTSTIVGNFTVLEDKDLVFTGKDSLKDSSYEQVKGDVSYKDRIIIFSPTKPFNANSRYLVCVKADGIKDVSGRISLTEYISSFYTEGDATLPKCVISEPGFGAITENFPDFKWEDQESKAYMFQVSKLPTFEVLEVDTIVRSSTVGYALPSFSSNEILSEGLYYARVKSVSGTWSDSHQFFIKEVVNATASLEDIIDDPFIEELLGNEEELEILEMFPDEDRVNVDVKTNIVYLKVRGEVSLEDLDLEDSFVAGELYDQDDEDELTDHGILGGSWTVIFDEKEDASYIVFTPEEVGGNA